MKPNKIILTLAAAAISMAAVAADIEKSAAKELSIDRQAFHPSLSPDGSLLLFSTTDHTGLFAYDMETGVTVTFDESTAAGFAPVFSAKGDKVYYQTATMIDGLLNRDVRVVTVKSGEMKQLDKPSRKSVELRALDGGDTFVSSAVYHINLVQNGVATELRPVADGHSYLWPSLSPDGKHILFNEPFQGLFICNTDGTGLRRLAAKGDFPCWLSDDTVVAVSTSDDGYNILSSQLNLIDVNSGEITPLTGDDVKVAELTASPLTGDMVFSTIEGKMFLMNVKINR
ncbi:MAG: hypothetical protein K2O00_00945 [Muribaculaceae bacterium]|nr:hypothetical protein [Muribaculaceae bacterium]